MTDLSALKVGDTVVLRGGITGREYRVRKVTRITERHVLIDGWDRKFHIRNGHEVGSPQWRGWTIDTVPDAMLRARESFTIAKLTNGYGLTRESIDRMRRDADEAEAVLRELGKWETAP